MVNIKNEYKVSGYKKITSTYLTFVRHKLPIKNNPIKHNLCRLMRTENDINWKEDRKNKNKDRWKYCHHLPILPFFGANHCLFLLNMA